MLLRRIPRSVFQRVARGLSSMGETDGSRTTKLWTELRSKNARATEDRAASEKSIDASAAAAVVGSNLAEGEGEDEEFDEDDDEYDDDEEEYEEFAAPDEEDLIEQVDDGKDGDEDEAEHAHFARRRSSLTNVPDTIAPLLFDHEFMKEQALLGMEIENDHFDPLDEYLADVFIDSMKTENNSVQKLITNDAGKRVVLPTPRSMEQLNSAMMPPVINAPKGGLAYALATAAWGVVHKNHYYSPSQKEEFVRGVASHTLSFEQQVAKDIEETELWDDMIMSPTFSKGFPGWEREQEALRSKDVVAPDFGEGKGDTDWNVDAVVDEDQL